VRVSIEGPNDHTQIQFDLNVGDPWSPRTGIWPWILWPVPAVVIYGIHLRLIRRWCPRSVEPRGGLDVG
jgi:hypothetical protein